MARANDSRTQMILGISVTVGLILFVVSVFTFGGGGKRFRETAEITADFRQVSGLRSGSPVQLEGIEIGHVVDREFVDVEYTCHPESEDRGRFGKDRTDECDRSMFCAPDGKCAELEPYSFAKDLYPTCEENAQCGESEICVTAEFRRRYRGVSWTGPSGLCDSYQTSDKRVRVTLAIYTDSLIHVREDSRAGISQNGVLGDQLVQISMGHGEQLPAGGRIQTTLAMGEVLDGVKDRFEGVFDKVEDAIGGIAELAKAMGDPETVRNIEAGLANANEVTRHTAEGGGTFGRLLNDETLTKDFSGSLGSVRNTTFRVNRIVGDAKDGLNDFDASMQPLVDEGSKSMAALSRTLKASRDPTSNSILAGIAYEPEGKKFQHVEHIVSDIKDISAGIARGEGGIGRLVRDPKVYDDLPIFFQDIGSMKAVKILVRLMRNLDGPAKKRTAD